MMGPNHAASGLAAGLALGLPAGLPPGPLTLLCVLTAAFAVLPDLDHPDSGISRCLGPVSRAVSYAVQKVSGGHRRGTHSLFGAAALTLLAFEIGAVYAGDGRLLAAGAGIAGAQLTAGWLASRRVLATRRGRGRACRAYAGPRHAVAAGAGLVLLYAAVGVSGLAWGRAAGAWMLGALISLALAALLRAWYPVKRLLSRVPVTGGLLDDLLPFAVAWFLVARGADLAVVPYALALGVVVHIAGDLPTVQGCPLGWPWAARSVGPRWRFVTGGPVERVIGRVLWCGVAALGVLQAGILSGFFA